jgi:UrcA family protein
MKNLTVLGAIAFLATSSLASAHEDGNLETRSTTVRFTDLDTENAPDVARLFDRIRHAAEDVCSDRGLAGRPDFSSGYRRCVDRALADAVEEIARPALTAYSNTRGTQIPQRVTKR